MLVWHHWRARASRAVSPSSAPAPGQADAATPGVGGGPLATVAAPMTPLSEARALLYAVFPPNGHVATPGSALPGALYASTAGAGAGSVAFALEGAALSQAKTSAELSALQAAVQDKENAVALAWGARRGPPKVDSSSGGEMSRPGWGDAFAAFPVSEMWKQDGGITGSGSGRAEWVAWHGSVTSLVEGMKGVLIGLVGAAPTLSSSLEGYIEMR